MMVLVVSGMLDLALAKWNAEVWPLFMSRLMHDDGCPSLLSRLEPSYEQGSVSVFAKVVAL